MDSAFPSPIPPHREPAPSGNSHPTPGRPGPSKDLLANLYQHLPVLVVHMSADGIVLHANPEACRVTGYAEGELVGQNFWATMFPGRLFAQVPRFISAMHPLQALARDVPMTLRTRDGHERTVAFSRFVHETSSNGAETVRSIVCIGNDLTDRLLDADRPSSLNAEPAGQAGPANMVEGELVTPLAITPPVPTPGEHAAAAIQQVHEFLTEVESRVSALETACAQGELDDLVSIATGLRNGAHACGLLDFSSRAEQLRSMATSGALGQVTALVHEIVAMCRPSTPRM